MSKIIKNEVVIIAILGLLLFMGWSIIDNQSYFKLFEVEKTKAADDSATATVSLSVVSSVTLTIDAGASIDFGTLTAGSAEVDTTRIKSVSNDTVNLAIGRDRSSPAHALASSADPSTYYINDTGGGIDVFDGSAGSTATWGASSTGLGFCLWAATENKTEATWGAGSTESDALNEYAALQASTAASTTWTSTSSGTKYTSIGYKLDVSGDQTATSYTGDVVFTCTTTS